AFLLAHLCFLAALVPLAVISCGRLVGVGLVGVSCLALLVWFWPGLVREGMTAPVTVYVVVLGAMVGAALLAKLPTRWTAVGAVCFAVSDAMIAMSRFVMGNEVLAVPIWWAYAAAQLLITAGFFFGRPGVAQQEEVA
ncbi:MAG TPA: lysoplasmalogenase, partial [Mycobacterium sp.]|nr:lysoplasmalogenase [Mycobacterium sp.]